ncbi:MULTISPECIES: hypothetical protein [Roseomonadaceae]|nr:hypothetical protein [Roseomonas oleicola]
MRLKWCLFEEMFGRGFNLATIMNDSGLMLTAAKAQVAIARG